MSERITYHLDEHVPNAVAKGLRRYGINVTTPSDANLLEAEDPDHLEYARRTGRMMVTYDADLATVHFLNRRQERDRKALAIRQATFNHVETDAKDAEVTTVRAVNEKA